MESEYMKYNEIAEMLKVLAHPIRICIVRGLLEQGPTNVTYMQSCLGIPQSTLSQHLQKLRGAKIVEGKRNGLEIYYEVSDIRVIELINSLFK